MTTPNDYIIDPQSANEMRRLMLQGEQFTHAMRGLFDGIDINNIHSVLDIGCGPGEWILQAAREYPLIDFYGIDVSQPMITYATTQAEAEGLENAHFEVRTATPKNAEASIGEMLEEEKRLSPPTISTPGKTYDFVNARLIAGFMKNDLWLPLIKQCFALLNPGGLFRGTEIDHFSIIGASALHHWLTALSDIMRREQRTFFAEVGQQGSLTTLYHTLLERAGFEVLDRRPYVLGYGAGMAAHIPMAEDAMRGFTLIKPYMMKGVPEKQLEQWEQEIRKQLESSDFQADIYYLSVIGRKPV